jgi:hypothetical protein
MGHLNLYGDDAAELVRIGKAARELIYNEGAEN